MSTLRLPPYKIFLNLGSQRHRVVVLLYHVLKLKITIFMIDFIEPVRIRHYSRLLAVQRQN